MRHVCNVLFVLSSLIIVGFASATTLATADIQDRSGEGSTTTVLAAPGETFTFPLRYATDVHTDTNIDPGTVPEGDYLGCEVFTRDGARVLLTNRMTDNVTVFDWATMAPLANIAVGRYPSGIAVSDAYAVVACAFENAVDVINLSDYTIAARIPTAEQPWVVRVSPDNHYAYVACDIPDICEVIDLASLTHVRSIAGFPVGLLSFSFNSEQSRNSVTFTNFEITPDGAYLVTSDFSGNILFFNAATGGVDYTVGGCTDVMSIALSGDGTKLIGVSSTNPMVVYRIDVATHTLMGSVTLTGYQYGMTFDPGVNQDGSKAFVSISSNSSAFVRFATGDFHTLTSTYSPFWIGVTPDHAYAISGQTYFSMLNFSTETMAGQRVGEPQAYGAVSPVGSRVAAHDPTRHEGVYFLDVATPSNPVYRGTTNAGLDPEGDAPRRVAVARDGSKAIVSNVLSDNVSIVNLVTKQVEATLDMGDRVQDVEITSDSRWAVVCAFNTNSVKIVDLTTNTMVKEVFTGSRPTNLSISADNQYAYVGNISSNTVSVVRLAGGASAEIAEVACGEIGTVWAAFGVASDIRVSPTGRYVLVAVSFDDQVKVIDTTTNTVVKTLTVGDFPLQLAFTSDGQYATVTNYFAHTYSVIRVDGASSTVVGTFPAQGQGPLRLAYNPIPDRIGIGNYTTKNLITVNPRTGAYLGTQSYAAYGEIFQVRYDEAGNPLVLTNAGSETPAHLHRGVEAIELPATPAYFDYSPVAQKAAVVIPGPDWLVLIDWLASDAPEVSTIPLRGPGPLEGPWPNPAPGEFRFAFDLGRVSGSNPNGSTVECVLVDPSGRIAASLCSGLYGSGRQEILSRPDIAAGSYFAIMRVDGRMVDRRKVVILDGGGR
jgi:YVTN family beta-propeller protein